MASSSKVGIVFTGESGTNSPASLRVTLTYEGYERHPATDKKSAANTLLGRQVQLPSVDILQGEFAIVDIETTGLSAERDAIIEIAAVNVGPGFQVVSEFSTLVKTDQWIPHTIVELTGITKADLNERGILLANAMSGLLNHVSNRPLFAHNAPFDLGFLARAADQCGIPFDNLIHDSIVIAREAWPRLPSYKLSRLAEQLDLAQRPTHRALDDVKTTLALLRAAGETISGARTLAVPNAALRSYSARPVARTGNENGALHGEVIVFTGELSLTREQAAELAAEAGCTVASGVTKKTTIVVLGAQDLTVLAGHEKSSKHRKAEELIAKGKPIRILTESDFLALVNNL